MAFEITALFERLGLSTRLSDYGINKHQSELIANLAITPGRADNNIVEINHQDVVELIELLFWRDITFQSKG